MQPYPQETMDAFLDCFSNSGKVTIDPVTKLVSVTGSVHLKVDRHELPVAFDRVDGDFDIAYNQLRSLKGCPVFVGSDFYCKNNRLTSLDGGPRKVVGAYNARNNHLTSLKGVPIEVGTRFILTVHPDTPLLNILHMEHYRELDLSSALTDRMKDVEEILYRYRGLGYDGMAPCAARMAKAGYGSNARAG